MGGVVMVLPGQTRIVKRPIEHSRCKTPSVVLMSRRAGNFAGDTPRVTPKSNGCTAEHLSACCVLLGT
jgi:hypothetical protein